MASSSPENNRRPSSRPLPKINANSLREVQKNAQETQKKVQKNTTDVNKLKEESRVNTQSISQLKDRITKTESKVRKNEQDIAKAQQTAQMADNNAVNAQRATVQNQKDIRGLQKSTLSAIKNRFAGFKNSFEGELTTVNASFSNINSVLSENASLFGIGHQNLENQVDRIENDVETLGYRVDDLTETLEETTEDLFDLNLKQDETSEDISYVIETMEEEQLERELEKEKALRIGAADKRREIKENILEGASKAIRNTGSALSKTTNSLLGGFNLIDAIKTVLSKLALGLLIVKFPEIYKNITDNIENWRRVAALLIKDFLRPAKAFFGLLINGAGTLLKWTFKGFVAAGKLFGKIIGFASGLGIKALRAIKRFLGMIFNAGKGALRSGSSVAGDVANQATRRGGSTAAGEVAQSPLQRFANWSGNLIRGGAIATRDAAVSIDGKLTGGRVTGAIGNSFNAAKDKFIEIFSKLKSKFSPISNAINGFKGEFKTALGQGPEAFKEFFGKSVNKVSGMFSGLQKSINPLLETLGPLARQISNIPGGKTFLKKFVGGAARSNPLTTFPIDYLLNHYVMGQDPEQALKRAVGSTLGSAVGAGLGAAFGGPLAPIVAPVAGFAGGEIGDYLTAKSLGYGVEGTTIKLLGDVIPALGSWFNGDSSSSEEGSEGMSKVSLATPTTSIGSQASPSLKNNNTASTISPSATSQAAATVPVSQYLRKPTPKAATPATGSPSPAGDGSPSVAQITLPAQTVDMPPQVIGDKSESLNKTPAQSIPSISPTNPSMDYLQVAAAEQFGMQLV